MHIAALSSASAVLTVVAKSSTKESPALENPNLKCSSVLSMFQLLIFEVRVAWKRRFDNKGRRHDDCFRIFACSVGMLIDIPV